MASAAARRRAARGTATRMGLIRNSLIEAAPLRVL
jgi:hypothetical protein